MIQDVKKELIKYGKLAGEKNFTPGVSGNLSARLNDKVLITTSGSANGYLDENDFALTDFEGNSLEEDKKPSSEKMLHIEFYKTRPDINYIIHVHSPYLSAFAACRIPLDEPLMAENVFYFGQIPLADYGLPSSNDLVEKTAKYFKDYSAVLMANHGVIIGGKTIKEAYLKLELAEAYAQTILNAKILGGAAPLTEHEAAQINSLKKCCAEPAFLTPKEETEWN
ncbi:MAG: class II aldolase/adducin family protein [Heliobacteriaceae bacterium]|jgi:L-fuculose-phosphate aldolase|nr:class II aldolase/adducin family protein [Heliobacteriaceae bacterium]